jgi:hypothetical protein
MTDLEGLSEGASGTVEAIPVESAAPPHDEQLALPEGGP